MSELFPNYLSMKNKINNNNTNKKKVVAYTECQQTLKRKTI